MIYNVDTQNTHCHYYYLFCVELFPWLYRVVVEDGVFIIAGHRQKQYTIIGPSGVLYRSDFLVGRQLVWSTSASQQVEKAFDLKFCQVMLGPNQLVGLEFSRIKM